MKKLVLFLTLFTLSAHAYVISRTETGAKIKWNRSNKELKLVVNPTPVDDDITLDITTNQLNSLSLTETQYLAQRFMEIVDEGAEEWNKYSPYTITPSYQSFSTFSLNDLENNLVFTNNFNFFNAGVLAITSISYEADDGTINSADILINQSFNNYIDFTVSESQSAKDEAYLGDIMTHELGHFLGLAHSEVINSSMVFSVFKNQHTIHEDDINGVLKNYGLTYIDGSIEGSVKSDTGSPILGAHVKLISVNDNSVAQSVLTDEDGKFLFDNVDNSKSYSIMVVPIKNLESLPDYYKNVKTDYCSGSDFVPSFFQTCDGRGKSRPQVFHLGDSTDYLDVGEVTIRCDENMDSEYLASKLYTEPEFYELNQKYQQYNYNFSGIFFDDELYSSQSAALTGGEGDRLLVDLSDISIASGDVLRLSIMTTALGSNYEILTKVKRVDSTEVGYIGGTDETDKKLTDYSINLNLSSTSSNNIFEITLLPIKLVDIIGSFEDDTKSYEIFSTPADLKNSNNLYFLNMSLGRSSSGTFVAYREPDTFPYEDNASCLEGTLSYSADVFTPLSSVRINAADNLDDQGVFSCGTIDIDDDSSGPQSFLLGLLAIILIFESRRYFLSKA